MMRKFLNARTLTRFESVVMALAVTAVSHGNYWEAATIAVAGAAISVIVLRADREP